MRTRTRTDRTTKTKTVYRLFLTTSRPNDPLYFRRTGRDKRYGWILWNVVGHQNTQKPTEWRTLDGVNAFVAKEPTLLERFTIVEINKENH